MADLNPYLIFDGNCAQAMRFYENVLGAKLEALMTFGESPGCENMAADVKGRIMHARLTIDGHPLMASDGLPEHGPWKGFHNVSLALTYATTDEAQRIFAALADGGQVRMPMQPTFWADAFGMLTDRFGLEWMVNGAMKPMPA